MKIHHVLFAACIGTAVVMSMLLKNYVIERYFFDRMLYQKSQKYGYPSGNLEQNTTQKRDRMDGYDLWVNRIITSDRGLKTKAGTFRIAVVGDSLVWGQGIRKEARFSEILERRL